MLDSERKKKAEPTRMATGTHSVRVIPEQERHPGLDPGMFTPKEDGFPD